MKKLESLNNSLFEKFESKKISNIAAITGGTTFSTCTTVTTSNPGGTDEISDDKTSASSTVIGGYSDFQGDRCNGLVIAPAVGRTR